MNLVTQIVDQLSGDTINKLSSLLGLDRESTEYASTAAVPALLSGLSGLASRDEGVKKLAGLLGGIDPAATSNLTQMLGGDTSGLMQKGMGFLSSLFGDSTTANLASAIGNYAGLEGKATKGLLAYLLPLVLGKVATAWKAKGANAAALTSLFSEQKQNIASAVPAGFSLADIPGWPGAKEAARATAQAGRRAADKAETAGASAASWIVPVLICAIGGYLLWQYLASHPGDQRAATDKPAAPEERVAMKPVLSDAAAAASPDVVRVTTDVGEVFKTLGSTLTNIKDAASAEAATPELKDLNTKLDGLRTAYAKLPDMARSTIQTTIQEGLDKIHDQVTRALNIPGLSETVNGLIREIVRKLEDLHLAQSTAPATPANN
jgi:hypothetical protein